MRLHEAAPKLIIQERVGDKVKVSSYWPVPELTSAELALGGLQQKSSECKQVLHIAYINVWELDDVYLTVRRCIVVPCKCKMHTYTGTCAFVPPPPIIPERPCLLRIRLFIKIKIFFSSSRTAVNRSRAHLALAKRYVMRSAILV